MRLLSALLTAAAALLSAADSLQPYASAADVPRDVVSLWRDVDFRRDHVARRNDDAHCNCFSHCANNCSVHVGA